MKFRGALFLFFFLAGFLFCFLLYLTLSGEIVEEPKEVKKEESFSLFQRREKTAKTFLFGGEERRSLLLTSNASTLTFQKTGEQRGLVEKMEGVEMIYQEELLNNEKGPLQRVMQLKAPRAEYNYQSKELIAEDVTLYRFLLQGHNFKRNFDEKTYDFKAFAKKMRVAFDGDIPLIRAESLKAEF